MLAGVKNEIASNAVLLADHSIWKTTNTTEGIIINLPEKAPDAIVSVIKLQLKGKVESVLDAKGKMKTGALD